MTAALLALGASALWGFTDFGVGVAARTRSAISVVAVTQTAGGSAALIASLLLGNPTAGIGGWVGLALVAGVASAVAFATFAQALAIGTMGIAGPVTACSGLIPAAAGLIEGQRLSPIEWGGALACVAGLVILARSPVPTGARRSGHSRSIALALVAMVAIGIVSLCLALGSRRTDVVNFVAVSRVTSALLALVLATATRALAGLPYRHVGRLALFGVGEFAALTCLGLAFQHGSLGVVGILGSLYPAVTVLLARIYLGERLGLVQRAGGVMAIAGTCALAVASSQ